MSEINRTKHKPGLLLGITILLAMGFSALLYALINAGTACGSSAAITSYSSDQIGFTDSKSRKQRSAPAGLSAQFDKLGEEFGGKVGIAVHSLGENWTAAYRGGSIFPQQSVSKLWVAVAVLDAVDNGKLSLSDEITVTRSDLTVFNQPIRERLGPNGYSISISDLLKLSLVQSDNTANDVLFRKVGGRKSIKEMLIRKELDEINIGPGEKQLQSQIAGVVWREEFSTGRAFLTAREATPMQVRQAALKKYLGNPPDATTPDGMVRALAKLQSEELLTPQSTELLLKLLQSSTTGTERLRGGLDAGWKLAHKTGTGQILGPLATAFNDVGILTAPDGQHYAVAVLISSTERSVSERQSLMAAVTQAVIKCHGENRWRCQ